ncbi:MAG: protein kinase [Deltaproteobacteria bacterium]|nr:protein kinase [Deltaproteobacteria bacterium]
MLCPACRQSLTSDALFCLRCGAPVRGVDDAGPPRQSYIGQQFADGRYDLVRELGGGGMGTVLEALDRRLNRKVALKILHPELVAHASARRRMAQEAQALARIEHPNVVRVFDVFDEGPLLVMVMELVSGGDLRRHIGPNGLAEARAVALMGGVLAGLQAIHDAGLIHRDLKPGNVLLAADGTPKVTDLGVARDSTARERTQLGATLGTLEYISPEQVQGFSVDVRSDLYAAGIVLFELLTGRKPYDAGSDFEITAAHVQQAPRLDLLNGRCGAGTVAVVQIALAKERHQRFGSAQAMATALRSGAARAPMPAAPPTVSPPPPPVPVAPVVAFSRPAAAADPWKAPGSDPPPVLHGISANPRQWSISFSGRLPRGAYFGSSVALAFGVIAAVVIAAMIAAVAKSDDLAVVFLLILALPAGLFGLSLSVRRAHDCDWTGWFAILTLIPYLGFVFSLMLLFNPGTSGSNRYGPDPLTGA